MQYLKIKQVLNLFKNNTKNLSFLDIRERKQYVHGFAFGSVNCPFSKFEYLIKELVPDLNTTLILIGVKNIYQKTQIQKILKKFKYHRSFIIKGDYKIWKKQKFPLWAGEYTFSKAFGEWIEITSNIKNLYAKELYKIHKKNHNYLQIDARPKKEFEKFSLPQSVQCSGGELPCFINNKENLRKNYIVHCAGRTRSIIACQTLKGVVDPSARKLLEKNIESFDLIGSLPAADDDVEKHLDIILDWGKNLNKRVHVHVDQLNVSSEKETALLIKKIRQHKMEGMVTAVHSISLACQNILYREGVYRAAKDVELSFITCPTAWIDSRRTEAYTVTHNAITPVDEMIKYGLKVGIGSDNIYDIYKPFSDGNMTTELKFLLEATHIYDIELLSDIATKNGREIIGI